jgi:hypothetical protein
VLAVEERVVATQILVQSTIFTDDATFRAWGKGLSDVMVAMGLTRTADAGAIDWATVTKPTAIYTVAGWEIFQFTDALQATAPVLIKIEWGTGQDSAYRSKAIWITVGTASDGAGNLTGLTTTRLEIANSAATAAAYVTPTLVAGDANRIAVFMDVGAAVQGCSIAFSVERTHASSGSDTAYGFVVLANGYSRAIGMKSSCGYYSFGFGVISFEIALGVLAPSVGSGSIGSQTMVFPIFPAAGPFLNPLLNILVVFAGNVTSYVQFSVGHYGATHTYMPLPTGCEVPGVRGAVAGLAFLLRWE